MQKVVIYANCQGGAIGKILCENKEFSKKFSWIIIPPVQNIKSKEEIDYLIASVQEADVFIYQIVNSPHFPIENRTDYLLNILNEKAVKISFPSLYFNGYFPHLNTMKGLVGPLNLMHDYAIAYCYLLGLSEKETLKLINKPNFYSKEISETLCLNSIEELSKREIENNIDIKISNFIKDNYKKEKLFYQINHPGRTVFDFLAKQILKKLNVKDTSFSSSKEYLNRIITPIYPSTYKNLGLNFTEQSMKYSSIGGFLYQEEVISRFFILYKNKDKKELLSLIKQTKPFIIDLIESVVFLKNKLINDTYKLTSEDLISEVAIDICRDQALEFENSDIDKAYHLMKIAHLARPTGPLIKEKFLEYTQKIKDKM